MDMRRLAPPRPGFRRHFMSLASNMCFMQFRRFSEEGAGLQNHVESVNDSMAEFVCSIRNTCKHNAG